MEGFIIILVLLYLAFHIGAGHMHHRYRKAHGLSPSIWWSLGRGPYGSIRVPGTHFRLEHKL
jgi:hypothetical protein